MFKLVAGRRMDDDPLASQPTLSRFENSATCAELQRLIDFNIDTGIERLREKHGGAVPDRVTLDLDTTDDPTHGDQQLTFFHGYYDQYQYLPLIISEPTTKHVFVAWLRPGTLHPTRGADDDLLRVVAKLRAARPDVAIHVRGDADFGLPVMMDCCEVPDGNTGKPRFTYTFGLRGNARLKALAQPLMDKATRRYERTGRKQRLFMRFMYQAESWPHPRQVVAKAECHDGGTNLRFVVTALPAPGVRHARRIYDDYIQRGTSEQRMDELKNGLCADRLSCHRFKANFLRLLFHNFRGRGVQPAQRAARSSRCARCVAPRSAMHLANASDQSRRDGEAELSSHPRHAGRSVAVGTLLHRRQSASLACGGGGSLSVTP